MRQLIELACAGDMLAGTLDEAAGRTGLLIVSGGNEIRCGAHRGMAILAQRLAAQGVPVFRFDRRGVGDSSGENTGFRGAAPDIAAAAARFVAETGVERLVAFGNCDAATALALFHQAAAIDALILANPWVVETADDLPPVAAIRARYIERLFDPRSWIRLVRGQIDLGKLSKGLRKITDPQVETHPPLADEMRAALANSGVPATIVLAARDATAIAFAAAWPHRDIVIHQIDTDSHSFARDGDAAALEAVIRAVL